MIIVACVVAYLLIGIVQKKKNNAKKPKHTSKVLSNTSRIISMTNNANYAQMGRWSQCCWCGTIYQHGDRQWLLSKGHYVQISDQAHFCGAPWQKKADDIGDMIPGKISCMPPESPFYVLRQSESNSPIGIPCS